MVHDLLAKQAAVDAADKDGMTALCAAAVRGHTACATELLKGHANVNARLNVGLRSSSSQCTLQTSCYAAEFI